jgi:hypothetical protein
MSAMQIFVQLAPEFGGDTFGPIIGPEYRVGTSDENHVRIAEGLGVEPHHVRLVRKSGETFFLTPVERSSAVYLFRAGQRQHVLVQGPTVIVPGDSFSLASPQGVRFLLIAKEAERRKKNRQASKEEEQSQAQQAVDRMKRGIVSEIFRRLRASILTTYIGRMIQNTWFFIKTRQFLSPVYIVSFVMMMSGWGFSFRACSQRNTAQGSEASAKAQLADCENRITAMNNSGSGGMESNLGDLTSAILGDAQWPESLGWDEMRQVMIQEIKDTLGRSADAGARSRLEGWYMGKGTPYVEAYTALEKGGMDKKIASMLAWSAIDTMSIKQARQDGPDGKPEMWGIVPSDQPTYRSCMRGPFRLTWRQAWGLGLEAPLDMLMDTRDVATLTVGAETEENIRKIHSGFQTTRMNAGLDALPPDQLPLITRNTIFQVNISDAACLITTRPSEEAPPNKDERLSGTQIASRLAGKLGAEASRLPAKDQPNWLSGRVAMLYAQDLTGKRGSEISVGTRSLGDAFSSIKDPDPAGYEMVARRTGQTLGRAVAIPCIIIMTDKKMDFPEQMGEPPSFDACAVLMARVQWDNLTAN